MPAKSLSHKTVKLFHLLIALSLMLNMVLSPTSLAMAAPSEAPLSAPFTSCADVTEIPQAECETLVALYNSTDGPNWVTNTNWLQTNTPCDWHGVSCKLGSVTQLSLPFNQLSGAIPAQLGSLTNLNRLDLSYNQLSGAVPPELGSLTNLTGLSLYSNQLSGAIPGELGNLTSLISLYLYSNQLSGAIPAELGNLTNLEYLSLASNQLSGAIPPELGNLTSLISLYLSSNQLSGAIPPELGSLTNLNGLSLDSNQLSGAIPLELGNLTNLAYLFLGSNQLSGTIPAELGNLTNLDSLYLHFNELSSTIPPELGNLTNLYYLSLSHNQLSGAIPPELGNLTKLQMLHISNTQISGEIPASFTNLINLYELSLSCGLTSTNPSVIAFIDGILGPGWDVGCPVTPANDNFADALLIDSTLYFDTQDTTLATTEVDDPNFPCGSGDQGTGSVWYRYTATADGFLALDTFGSNYDTMLAVWVGTSGALTNMACGDDSISTWQSSLGVSVTSGQTYYIEIAGYDSGILEFNADFIAYQPFTSCSSVTGISQTECEGLVALYNSTDGANWINNTDWLQADAPCFWYGVYCENGRFESLGLPDNQLTGSIPPELGNLVNLRVLHLGGNQLSGNIPVEFGNLTKLEHLVLSGNQLTGNIPPVLGTLINLWGLRLESNQLTGNIPESLGNLTNLSGLSLSQNQLTGNIPQSLGNLTKLWSLYLAVNQLTGNIPHELGNLTNLRYLDLYENQLTGNIPPELGNLTLLRRLFLDTNQLSGEFPTSITNLTALTDLTFDCTLTASNPAVVAFIVEKAPDIVAFCARSISGQIYAADGVTPIANIAVSLVSADNYEQGQACTGADGHFTFTGIPVDVGLHVVAVPAWRCLGQPEGYVREYWQDTYDLEEATLITLSESQPNYAGIVFKLEQGQTATQEIGTGGGTVVTPEETVSLVIPPGAVSDDTTFTVTDGSAGYQVATDQGDIGVVLSTTIGPEGTTFAVPATLFFNWPDANDDGIVDGTTIPEGNLYLSKDGVILAGPCSTDSACDLDANTITVQISSLSFFVVGPVNQTPTNISLSKESVAENQPIGTTVGTLTTTDPDLGDTFTYVLVAGTGDGDNAVFALDGAVLKTASVFDYAVKNSYSIRVRTTDAGGLSYEKPFVITVTDVTPPNQAPTNISLSNASLGEGQPAGTGVGTLTTTDPDAGDTFAYALVGGTGDNDNAAFAITGNALKAAQSFNYAFKNSYSVRVRSTDNGGLSFEKAFTITISNQPAVFSDVPDSYWAVSFIERLYNSGITGGCATTPTLLYCPDNTVTRAQMAVFLLKSMHGKSYTPPLVGDSTGFGDVATSHWAAAWIKQLATEGITGGCGVGLYCPEAPVTRAQMAVFLLKAKNGSGYLPPAIGAGSGFTDVADDYWAAVWIKQLAADGITGGCGPGLYCPENSVTRAQMAVFIVKTFGLP